MIIFGGRMKLEFFIWLILLSLSIITEKGMFASSSYNLYWFVGSLFVLLSFRIISGLSEFAFKLMLRSSKNLYSSSRIGIILLEMSLTRANLYFIQADYSFRIIVIGIVLSNIESSNSFFYISFRDLIYIYLL